MLQDKLDLGALIGGSLADLAMKIVAALLILVVGLWLVKMIVKLVKKGKKFQKPRCKPSPPAPSRCLATRW